ncbi:hypothetical protein [Streptomyces sp. NPDC101132]|uniref:hypothetical protein n=1 Tax=Streptomyces sp. NPDC101132 TaxID=3366110 RepID=UPI003817F8CE
MTIRTRTRAARLLASCTGAAVLAVGGAATTAPATAAAVPVPAGAAVARTVVAAVLPDQEPDDFTWPVPKPVAGRSTLV